MACGMACRIDLGRKTDGSPYGSMVGPYDGRLRVKSEQTGPRRGTMIHKFDTAGLIFVSSASNLAGIGFNGAGGVKTYGGQGFWQRATAEIAVQMPAREGGCMIFNHFCTTGQFWTLQLGSTEYSVLLTVWQPGRIQSGGEGASASCILVHSLGKCVHGEASAAACPCILKLASALTALLACMWLLRFAYLAEGVSESERSERRWQS